jgi:hypothetical protein
MMEWKRIRTCGGTNQFPRSEKHSFRPQSDDGDYSAICIIQSSIPILSSNGIQIPRESTIMEASGYNSLGRPDCPQSEGNPWEKSAPDRTRLFFPSISYGSDRETSPDDLTDNVRRKDKPATNRTILKNTILCLREKQITALDAVRIIRRYFIIIILKNFGLSYAGKASIHELQKRKIFSFDIA